MNIMRRGRHGSVRNKVFAAGLALATIVSTLGAGITASAAENEGGVDDAPLAENPIGIQYTVDGLYLDDDGTTKVVHTGSTITYKVQIDNQAPDELTSASFDVQVPEGTHVATEDQKSHFGLEDFEGNKLVFDYPVVVDWPADDAVDAQIGPFVVMVNASRADGAVFEGALPSADKQEGYPVKVVGEKPEAKLDVPSFEAEVVADGGFSSSEVEPGGKLTYKMTVKGGEGFDGSGKVTFHLPEGFSFAPDKQWTVGERPGHIEYTEDELGFVYTFTELKSEDVLFEAYAVAPDNLTEDSELNATVMFEYDSADGSKTGVQEHAIPVTVLGVPEEPVGPLVAKVAFDLAEGQSDDVAPGEGVKLVMKAVFESDETDVTSAKDVKFNITAPEGVLISDFIANGASAKVSGQKATMTFGTVPLGKEISANLKVVPDMAVAEQMVAIGGFVSYAEGEKTDDAYVYLNVGDGIDRPVEMPEVTMKWTDTESTDERTYRDGDEVPVTITVMNNDADVALSDCIVRFVLPEGFSVKEGLWDKEYSTDENGVRTYECKISEIKPKTSKDVNVVFVSDEESTVPVAEFAATFECSNMPKETAIEGPINSRNYLVALHEIPDADSLSVVMSQDGTINEIKVGEGQRVAYEVTVYNNGNADLDNVVVRAFVPDGMKYGKASVENARHNDGVVTWTVGRLGKGENKSMKFGVTVPYNNAADSYTAYAEGSAEGVDTAESNHVTMRVGAGDLSLSLYQKRNGGDKTSDEMEVDPGETFYYIMKASNKGTAPVAEATAKMVVPGSFACDADDLPEHVELEGKTIVWHIYDLAEGESREVSIQVTAPSKVYNNSGSLTGRTDKSLSTDKVQVRSSLYWKDTAGRAHSVKSNVVTTMVKRQNEPKVANSTPGLYDNNNASNNQQAQAKKPRVNNTGLRVITESKTVTTNRHMIAYQNKETIVVTASYTKLAPNTHYKGTVGLVDANGGVIKDVNGKDCTAPLDFTSNGSGAGSIEGQPVEFVIDGKAYVNKCIYGAMDVTADGGKVTAYRANDIEEGTMHGGKVMGIAMDNPTVSTTNTGNGIATIKYQNLVSGQAYRVVVALVDRSTGRVMKRADGKAVSGTTTFNAEKSEGSVDIEIQYGMDDVRSVENKALYVTLYERDGKVVLAADQDINKAAGGSGSGSVSGNSTSIYATPKTGLEEEGADMRAMVIVGALAVVAILGCGAFMYYRKRGLGHKDEK